MAQPATNPKIEELRLRLRADPKSRLFYQLAEELRRAGQPVEAETILRSGLSVYPTYLAAWVSLGRVLRELKNDGAAIEVLGKAMQLDPGNVVAARLLADAHRALGDNLEAIKKYKLVHALMPGDEELKATIDELERELHPPESVPVPAPPPLVQTPVAIPETPFVSDAMARGSSEAVPESPFDKTRPPFAESTGDDEPMLVAHDESPFEEAPQGGSVAAFDLEQPSGFHVEEAPAPEENLGDLFPEEELPVETEASPEELLPQTVGADEDVFLTATPVEPAQPEAVTDTSTMADLYARQGLLSEARHIYENILVREPGNADVRAKLDALSPQVNPRIDRLERWLSKVGRKGVGRV